MEEKTTIAAGGEQAAPTDPAITTAESGNAAEAKANEARTQGAEEGAPDTSTSTKEVETDAGTTETKDETPADKPFLGEQEKPKEKEAGKATDKAAVEVKAPDEKAYLDAVKADENILGKHDGLAFDERLVKSVIPVCQKFGVSTEAANAMANAFAKAQLEGAREAMKTRSAYFTKMKNEATAKYGASDFAQINRGIDKCFKPGGIMNNVIRNSELGADPEFLALMHRLGAEVMEDTAKGAAGATGGGTGEPGGYAGLAKMWK